MYIDHAMEDINVSMKSIIGEGNKNEQDIKAKSFILLTDKVLVDFILENKNTNTQLKAMANATRRALRDYTTSIQTRAGTQPKAKDSKVRESQTSPSFAQKQMKQTPNKRRTWPQEDTASRKKARQAATSQSPLPTPGTSPPWQVVETRKTKKNKNDKDVKHGTGTSS